MAGEFGVLFRPHRFCGRYLAPPCGWGGAPVVASFTMQGARLLAPFFSFNPPPPATRLCPLPYHSLSLCVCLCLYTPIVVKTLLRIRNCFPPDPVLSLMADPKWYQFEFRQAFQRGTKVDAQVYRTFICPQRSPYPPWKTIII
jgi:hypothetical protein